MFRGGACIMAGAVERSVICIAEFMSRTGPRESRRLEGTSRTCRRARSWILSRPTFDWVDRFVADEDLVRYNFRSTGWTTALF